MPSSLDVPHTTVSSSLDVPQTTVSPSSAVPQTTVSPSSAVPQTTVSSSDDVDHVDPDETIAGLQAAGVPAALQSPPPHVHPHTTFSELTSPQMAMPQSARRHVVPHRSAVTSEQSADAHKTPQSTGVPSGRLGAPHTTSVPHAIAVGVRRPPRTR